MRQEWVGKRQAVRTNVQLRAQMRFGAGRPPVDCIVMDISLTGARVIAPDEGPYPNDFDVFIPARSETKWARIRWREGRQLGVEFLKAKPEVREEAGDASILERLAKLEARTMAEQGPSGATGLDDELERRLLAIEDCLDEMASAAGSQRAEDENSRYEALSGRLADAETARQEEAGRFDALDARLLAIESREPDSAPAPDGALEASALIGRVQRLESACSALATELDGGGARIAEIDRRANELGSRLYSFEAEAHTAAETRERAGAPRAADEAAGAIEARLSGLEASVGELRASLRTLILLMASQIKRSNA